MAAGKSVLVGAATESGPVTVSSLPGAKKTLGGVDAEGDTSRIDCPVDEPIAACDEGVGGVDL